jgi:chromosome segregation ATPase
LKEYNQLVHSLELIIDPDINQFLHNKTQAQKSIKDLEQQQEDKQLELRELENEKTEIKNGIIELMDNIQTLQRNQNNITGRVPVFAMKFCYILVPVNMKFLSLPS